MVYSTCVFDHSPNGRLTMFVAVLSILSLQLLNHPRRLAASWLATLMLTITGIEMRMMGSSHLLNRKRRREVRVTATKDWWCEIMYTRNYVYSSLVYNFVCVFVWIKYRGSDCNGQRGCYIYSTCTCILQCFKPTMDTGLLIEIDFCQPPLVEFTTTIKFSRSLSRLHSYMWVDPASIVGLYTWRRPLAKTLCDNAILVHCSPTLCIYFCFYK